METPQVLIHRRGNKKGLIARASGTGSVKVCRVTRKLLEPYGGHRDGSCASARSVRAKVAETSPCPLRDDPTEPKADRTVGGGVSGGCGPCGLSSPPILLLVAVEPKACYPVNHWLELQALSVSGLLLVNREKRGRDN